VSAVAEASAQRSLQSLPPDWTWARLGDICDAINGRAFKSSEWGKSGLPIVRIQNLKDADADFNYFAGELDERHRVRRGDLLFAWSGTPGTSFGAHVWKGPEAALNQHIFNVKFDLDVLDPRYFCLALNQNVSRYVAQAQGGVGLAHITKSKFLDSFIPLAPMPKQLELVAEVERQFSRLDEAIANLKRVKAKVKRYRAAVLQSAVDGRIHVTDAPANVESPNRWGWATCGDVIESIQAGASFKCVERPPVDGEVGVVKVSAVTWGEFDEVESKTCLDPERVREALFIRPGDFLFSRANTIELVGACVIAKTVTKSLMLSDKILRFRLAPRLDPKWLLICLQSRFGRFEIERLATGNQESMRNIGQDRIRQIRLPLPVLTEQRHIVAEVDRRLSIVREVEAEVDANLKRAQALRHAILGATFGGKEHES
jgi:type I restriction enzyme, S subunit